jgi:DNA end-binding protein Ku
MPARSIATAYISFGLVTIPIKLYSASQTTESISFRMLHKGCGTPLKQQYICPKDNVTVERDDVVKGYEFAKDQYVLFTPEELKAVEEEATKTISITEFVPLSKVDSLYFDKAYYLGPDKGGDKAYRLLGEAMKKTGLAGLATYAARGKQYIVLIRPVDTGEGLVMQQLRYADEVRPFSEVPIGDAPAVKEAELGLAVQLIQQSVSEEFHPENFKDEVRMRVQQIINQKVEGQEVTLAPEEQFVAPVIDLMEALKASLAQGGGKGLSGESSGGARSTPPPEPARLPARAAPRKAADKAQAADGAATGRKKASR